MVPAEERARFTSRPRRACTPRWVAALGVAALDLGMRSAALAQVLSVLSGGPPVQVVPYVSEPGVPPLTIAPGTANPFAAEDDSGGSGTGGSGTSGDSSWMGSGSAGSGGSGSAGSSDALTTMMGTSWGLTAVSNATSLGVNPSALAATCVMESGCSQPASGSGAQGVFQMFPAAFQEGLQTALATNPALASQIAQGSAGMNDPTTEAIAASGYLMQAAQALQDSGIPDANVVQAREYYQFGPTYGPQVALAPHDAMLSQILPSSWLAKNGISSTETVSQWQTSVQAKIGSAASQPVMS